MRAFGTHHSDFATKILTRTVEIECIVGDPPAPSYRIAGAVQKSGDRARIFIGDAKFLAEAGKARIIPDSEKAEML